MSETELDVSSPEQSSAVQLEAGTPETLDTPKAESSESSSQEYNWKQMRDAKRQLEIEVQALRQQMEDFARAKVAPESPEEEIKDDDLIEGRHLKKALLEVRQLLNQQQQQAIPQQLKAKYSDFDEVVSKENVEKLKATEPELYASIISGSDLYTKGVAAYKTIKSLGIAAADPYRQEKDQVQRNQKKPVSLSAAQTPSAIHGAHNFERGLTPELQKALLKEMVEAARG